MLAQVRNMLEEQDFEYLEPAWFRRAPALREDSTPANGSAEVAHPSTGIDRTVKLYIGGKQARPDSGYSFPVHGSKGELLGEAPLGNRKDIRNAVEAAHKAESPSATLPWFLAPGEYHAEKTRAAGLVRASRVPAAPLALSSIC